MVLNRSCYLEIPELKYPKACIWSGRECEDFEKEKKKKKGVM